MLTSRRHTLAHQLSVIAMSQNKIRWSQLLQRWGRATLLSSATLVGAMSVLSAGSAQAVICGFDPMGFNTCTYGNQFLGGGPGDLANPGPIPPTISGPFTGQWFDTQIAIGLDYYPTDKQIKYVVPFQNSNGFSVWGWVDNNDSGTWRIPPDPHSTDFWVSYVPFNIPVTLPDSLEYMVRITEPGYRFEDVGLIADLFGDASVTKDVYTVSNGGKGSLIGSLTFNSSSDPDALLLLPLNDYQELYIVDTVNPGSNGAVSDYYDAFRQERFIPPAPGPLPLLGVGSAFGFSRKLRRRLQASRLSPSA